jgi:hypothetical protein
MMRWILLVSLLVQSAPPQSEADKIEAALKKFGERKYRILEKGKETGTLTLKTRVETRDKEKRVILEDRMEMKNGKLDADLELTEESSLDKLLLIRAARSGTAPDDEAKASVIQRGGDAFMSANGQHLIIRDTKTAIGERAVMRLVCLKEQKVGDTFRADVLVLDPMDWQEGRRFKCVAKEVVDVGDRKIETFKWEEKYAGTSSLSGKEIDVNINNAYWVGPDGYPVRMKLGEVEMHIDAK